MSFQGNAFQDNAFQVAAGATSGPVVLPAGARVFDNPPPDYPPAGPTWVWSYNRNLIGKDQLPPGKQSFDLPPPGYPPAGPPWAWSYNRNLLGQDQLPPGVASFELPPALLIPQPPAQTWVWSRNLNLIAQDQLPPGKPLFDLPPPGPLPAGPTLVWKYNPNLIGQDQLPPGKRSFDLPIPPPLPGPTTAFALPIFIRGIVVTFNRAPGTAIYDLPPVNADLGLRNWTWSYNQNLRGQDVLPPGKESFDLPAQPFFGVPPSVFFLPPYILGPAVVFFRAPGGAIYDLPPVSADLAVRGWAWSYNRNLIGKDQLPVGERVFDSPQGYPLPPPSFTMRGPMFLPVVVQHGRSYITIIS